MTVFVIVLFYYCFFFPKCVLIVFHFYRCSTWSNSPCGNTEGYLIILCPRTLPSTRVYLNILVNSRIKRLIFIEWKVKQIKVEMHGVFAWLSSNKNESNFTSCQLHKCTSCFPPSKEIPSTFQRIALWFMAYKIRRKDKLKQISCRHSAGSTL